MINVKNDSKERQRSELESKLSGDSLRGIRNCSFGKNIVSSSIKNPSKKKKNKKQKKTKKEKGKQKKKNEIQFGVTVHGGR